MLQINETLPKKFVFRAVVLLFPLICVNFFYTGCNAFAQDPKDAPQKVPAQSKSDSAANEGAILTSNQAAKPELVLKREKWKPVIWFIGGAAVALLIMYYTVRIFHRPIAKK